MSVKDDYVHYDDICVRTSRDFAGRYRNVKMASFSLFNTLILPANGSRSLNNEGDVIWAPYGVDRDISISKYLTSLKDNGWMIMVIANVNDGEMKVIKKAIDRVCEEASIDPCVVLLNKNCRFPKGSKSLSRLLLSILGVSALEKGSFHCGDNDDRCSPYPQFRKNGMDRVFADNVGLTYYTPISLFGPGYIDAPQKLSSLILHPQPRSLVLSTCLPERLTGLSERLTGLSPTGLSPTGLSERLTGDGQDRKKLLIMVGQSDGKKSVICEHLASEGFMSIFNDDVDEVRKAMTENSMIIIRGSNPSFKKRSVFVDLAKKHDFDCYILWSLRYPEEAVQNLYMINRYMRDFDQPSSKEGIVIPII